MTKIYTISDLQFLKDSIVRFENEIVEARKGGNRGIVRIQNGNIKFCKAEIARLTEAK